MTAPLIEEETGLTCKVHKQQFYTLSPQTGATSILHLYSNIDKGNILVAQLIAVVYIILSSKQTWMPQ